MDFVRQGALIAMALVLMQQPEARVAPFRKQLAKFVADKHEEIMCRCVALIASSYAQHLPPLKPRLSAQVCRCAQSQLMLFGCTFKGPQSQLMLFGCTFKGLAWQCWRRAGA